MTQRLLHVQLLATITFLFPLANFSIHAQDRGDGVPKRISYQGILAGSDGRALPDGSYRIDIAIYDAADAPTPLWSETHKVALSEGLFNLYIGENRPLDLSFDRPYWLGLALDGNAEMTPRTPLVAAPYTFRAGVADRLEGGAVSTLNGMSGPVRIEGYAGTVVTVENGVIRIGSTSQKETMGPKVEIAPTSAQTSNDNRSVIHLDENGSGTPNLIEMESGGTDMFVVENDGDITAVGTVQTAGIAAGTAAISGSASIGDGSGADNVTIDPGSGVLSVSNARIRDVGEPMSAQDAATKNYADSSTGSRAPKDEPFITFGIGSSGLTDNRVLTAGTGVSITDANTDDGTLTVAVGQDIGTTASPTFAGATLTSLSDSSTADEIVVSNGGILETRSAASLVPGLADNFWAVSGNAGTTAGANFIGTTDNVPFEIHVDDASSTGTDGRGRVARFEPHATSPNVVLGYQGNLIDSGVVGAAISGGGSLANVNRVGSSYGTISGGRTNTITTTSVNAFIGGGWMNVVSNSSGGVIVGGTGNDVIGSSNSTIGGGVGNILNLSSLTTIGGGLNNLIDSSEYSSVGGGRLNKISRGSTMSTIAGGNSNVISRRSSIAAISGGSNNMIDSSINATIGGGVSNWIKVVSHYSVVGGGVANRIEGGSSASTIPGGYTNTITASDHSTIAGGRGLTLSGADRIFGFLSNDGAHNMTISTPDVAVFGNSDLWLANNDNAASAIRFYESKSGTGAFPNGANYTSFRAGNQSADIDYTLPTTTSATGTVGNGLLQLDSTTGQLSWVMPDAITPGWKLNGNAGTTAGTDFIGTTDDEAFEIRVDASNATATSGSGRVLRVEPKAQSPNIIVGFQGNTITAQGGTISGGGSAGSLNNIASDFGTVGGGQRNQIDSAAVQSTIAGGSNNRVKAGSWQSTIAGGNGNTINPDAWVGTIGGGGSNTIDAGSFRSIVGGGYENYIGASSQVSTVSGGQADSIYGGASQSTIGGGTHNVINTGSGQSTIGGGGNNFIKSNASQSTISGGILNVVDSGSTESVIGGGRNNVVSKSSLQSTIGGGRDNVVSQGSTQSTIAGGMSNAIQSKQSTIAGGVSNVIQSGQSTIAGGVSNVVQGSSGQSVISGGGNNSIKLSAGQSTISGGGENVVSNNAEGSVIGGGVGNTVGVGARLSTIAGGRGLTLNGLNSFGYLANNVGGNDMTVSDSKVAVFGNTDLWLANNDNSAKGLRFYEANNTTGSFPAAGVNYTSFRAGNQSADIEYQLPAGAGSVGSLLSIDAIAGTQVVLDWASDASLTSLTLNGATPVTNSRIVVNEGHWTSQGTAPTAVGDGTNLAATITVAPPSTDVVGTVSATDGGGVGVGVITVTFDAAYGSSPIVLIAPANLTAAQSVFYLNNVSATSFDINIGTTSGNGTDTYTFNYHVIEAN